MCLIVKNLRQRCRSSIKAGLLEVHYPELCGALQELESDIGTKLCNETTWMALPLEQVANQALVTTLTENLYKVTRVAQLACAHQDSAQTSQNESIFQVGCCSCSVEQKL